MTKVLSEYEKRILNALPICHKNATNIQKLADELDLERREIRRVLTRLIKKGRLIYRGDIGVFIPHLECQICLDKYHHSYKAQEKKGFSTLRMGWQMKRNLMNAYNADDSELIAEYAGRIIF